MNGGHDLGGMRPDGDPGRRPKTRFADYRARAFVNWQQAFLANGTSTKVVCPNPAPGLSPEHYYENWMVGLEHYLLTGLVTEGG